MLLSLHSLRLASSRRLTVAQCRHLHFPARNSPLFQHGTLTLTRLACQGQSRGKKTKASVKLDDLPQGLIPSEPLPLEDDTPQLPTVLQQHRSNMTKFQNCVVLTRVGGFYELYFEQAVEIGPLLNLKVADKQIANRKKKGEFLLVPMVNVLSRVSEPRLISTVWLSILSIGQIS